MPCKGCSLGVCKGCHVQWQTVLTTPREVEASEKGSDSSPGVGDRIVILYLAPGAIIILAASCVLVKARI